MAQGAARGAMISGATGGDPADGARRGAILGGIKAKRKQAGWDNAYLAQILISDEGQEEPI